MDLSTCPGIDTARGCAPSCARPQLPSRASHSLQAGTIQLAPSLPHSCLPSSSWDLEAHFGRRERGRKLPVLFFFFFLLKRILKCSALKRKNNSAEAFTELRRCHYVWAKAELYRGCLRAGGFSPAMTYKMKTLAVVAGAIQGMPWRQLEGWAGCLGRSCSPRKLACCSAVARGSTLGRLGQVCRRGCPAGSVSLASFGDP